MAINSTINMELDMLEKHMLKALSICSVYEIPDIKKVYLQCRSFDKTIEILKYAQSTAISLDSASSRKLLNITPKLSPTRIKRQSGISITFETGNDLSKVSMYNGEIMP
jgi:hypothetical protein